MAIKYTQGTLDKIEKVLEESGYVLRFEKGNFNSGFCILEHRKVVVVNKFLDVEGRINILIDILSLLKVERDRLSEESRKIFDMALKEAAQIILPAEDDADETQNKDDKTQ